MAIFVGIFSLIGVVLLLATHAGVRKFVAVEADAASRSGSVNVISDSGATAGKALAFVAPPNQTPSGCSGISVAAGGDVVAAVANAPAGSTVCISSGTYKLTSQIVPKNNVILWGAPGSILDGSKTIASNSWSQQGSYWVASGFAGNGNGGGQCDDNTLNPCLPTDQLFMNDTHLTRVMRLADVNAGKFYVDYGANKVYIADNPTGKTMDIARTEFAIKSSSTGVTVKGLTVQKFATKAQQGAVSAEGAGWKITGNLFRWNHAAGLHLAYADNSTVDGNTMSQNGQIGIAHYNSQNVTISNNNITANNTDGFWIADWESGGYKTTNSSANFVGNSVTNNLGVGVWVDVDGKGVTIDNNSITSNAADGVRYEISYNGVIKNNNVINNGFGMKRGADYSLYAVAGINVNSSSAVDIFGNTVSNNANGIVLQMRNRGSGKYGLWALTNATVHNNTITMKSGTRYGENVSGLGQLVSDNSYFTSKGNRFYDNTYYLDSSTAKRFAWNNSYITSANWKAAGQDVNGTFY